MGQDVAIVKTRVGHTPPLHVLTVHQKIYYGVITMNGQIQLNINNNSVTVMGGAYLKKPRGVAGVKLAEEIDAPCKIDLPIADFSVPNVRDTQTALAKSIAVLNKHRQIYVGCMGGFGRTGIFLALLTKFAGEQEVLRVCRNGWRPKQEALSKCDNPVEWVRANYVPNAVETPEQHQFVKDFDLRLLRTVARFL